jgi:hypothetical protein
LPIPVLLAWAVSLQLARFSHRFIGKKPSFMA